MAQSVADFLRTRGVNQTEGSEGSGSGDTIGRILRRRGSTALEPIVRAIYEQESRGGRVDTSRVNNSRVRGPMQVKDTTFAQMQRERRIPANYRWDDPDQNIEAGIAYVEFLAEQTGGDPRKIFEGYYGGPGAIGRPQRRDPRNPNAPTVGEYRDQAAARMGVAGRAPSEPSGTAIWDYLKAQRSRAADQRWQCSGGL